MCLWGLFFTCLYKSFEKFRFLPTEVLGRIWFCKVDKKVTADVVGRAPSLQRRDNTWTSILAEEKTQQWAASLSQLAVYPLQVSKVINRRHPCTRWGVNYVIFEGLSKPSHDSMKTETNKGHRTTLSSLIFECNSTNDDEFSTEFQLPKAKWSCGTQGFHAKGTQVPRFCLGAWHCLAWLPGVPQDTSDAWRQVSTEGN